MKREVRRRLFYGFVIVFLAISGTVVAYSQGWRITPETCTLTRVTSCIQEVGGIYIATHPQQVAIAIHGVVFSDESGLLKQGTLIGNLLPQTYSVTITKEGYTPWEKEINVEPAKVTDLSYIILLPTTLPKEQITTAKGSAITAFEVYGNQHILTTKGGLYYEKEQYIQKLRGNARGEWNRTGNQFITEDTTRGIYYRYRTETPETSFNLTSAFHNLVPEKTPVKKIDFHPFDENKFIIQSSSTLYIMDTARIAITTLFPATPTSSVYDWVIGDRTIYALMEKKNEAQKTARTYAIRTHNIILNTETELATIELEETPRHLVASPDYTSFVIVTEKETLYLVNPSATPCCVKIASRPTAFAFAPESARIAIAEEQGTITLYFIRKTEGSEKHEQGEVQQIGQFENPTNLTWHSAGHHLFIETQNKNIEIMETNTNAARVPHLLINTPAWHYEPQTNVIYFIEKGALWSTNFLQ